jgi:hypothetical protein
MAMILIAWRDRAHYPRKWGAPDQGGNGVRGGRPGLNLTESGIEIYPTLQTLLHLWSDEAFLGEL